MKVAWRLAACLLTFAAGTVGASAHEFWIEPETYTPKPGAAFRVTLQHGERFRGTPVPYVKARTERFEVRDAAGVHPVVARDGAPVQFGRCGAAGGAAVVFESAEFPHELPAARFEAYLREEGLGAIVEARRARGEQEKPGRESYSRCAKALLGAAADAPVGLPLEIVRVGAAEGQAGAPSDAAPRTAERVAFRVLFRGEPLAGASVVAVSAAEPERLQRVTTDARGVAEFALDEAGPWMVTTIHMIRAAEGAAHDWRTYWSSLNFERAAPPASPGS